MATSSTRCDSLCLAVFEALGRPRARDLADGKHAWVQNWNFPTDKDVAYAYATALEHRAQACSPLTHQPIVSLSNVRLYLAPCFTQCLHLSPLPRHACACRACASTTWQTFTEMCKVTSPLAPFLERSWCEAARRLTTESCPPIASSNGSWDSNRGTELLPHGSDQVDADGAPVDICRTAFNESCCPTTSDGARCGGPARGRCLPISHWASVQPLCRGGRCEWPVRYAASQCHCTRKFAGSACDGCARPWKGEDCQERRSREVGTSTPPKCHAEYTHTRASACGCNPSAF